MAYFKQVEAGLCYVSDDGKDVLCDRMPSGETWQVCLKCNRYPLDWCRKAEPVEEDSRNADDPYSSKFGRTSTASIMTENTTPKPKMVYRRKKLRKDSNFKLEPNMQASANYPSVISSAAHLSSEEQPAGFQVNHEIEVVKDPTMPSVLFDGVAKDRTHKNLGISSVNDSCSSSKPDMETEMDENGECSSSSVIVMDSTKEEVTEKDFCINILRSHGLLREYAPEDNVASGEDAVITGNSCCSRSCKICDHLDSSLNMLLCDHCEDAYHPSCYNPRSKKLPIDEWFCHSCLKKRQKILKEPNIHNELGKCRATSVKAESNSILLMLRNTGPYTTSVRVGKGFQAEVPDWSGPIESDEDALPEPLEINPSDFNRLLEENTRSLSKLSAIGNWIQCQAVIDRSNGTICGKWRRAPFFEVQTDVWECFCAIHWDPSHADCAVPQELETDQVLKQLKYVEVLRPRVAAKRKKSDCTQNND
ncbi:unnamed protein product [Sphenostylis stenocarpa]|uniref:Uncharacterized protein n=1 Tax=Sphenostylis stenocarpa TaxID=92480 RepID=A0AA86SXZ8_9FABA|nr:unnamed protein product [Sphenostylis stenocarpa]